MTGDEPPLERVVVEHRRRLAKLGERRVRVGEELGCGGIELHDLLARADVLEKAVHAERDDG